MTAISLFGILFSGRTNSLNAQNPPDATNTATAWTAPDPATIPEGPLGDSIRLGRRIFNDTPKYAASYVGNKMTKTRSRDIHFPAADS